MTSLDLKELKRLATVLEKVAPEEFKREARKAFAKSAPRVKAELSRSASSYMPDRYATDLVRSLKVRTRQRGGNRVGATVTASGKSRRGKPRQLGTLNSGKLRHPTYGHKPWVNQAIRPGWADDTFDREAGEVRTDIIAAVDKTIKRIIRAS